MGSINRTALLLLIMVACAFAEDFVVVNSDDGRDTLSGIFYANAKGLPVKFMPVPGGNVDVLTAKVGSDHSVLLIQSKETPISNFVESELTANNNTVELLLSDDGGLMNLELAKRSGAKSFILVDPSFSDSALSVLPYAALSKSYVIFANSENADQVKAIVVGKTVMIYGYVDSDVRAKMASQNPVVVGKGEDKFEDNIAMVEKTLADFSIKRAYMVDGTFVEDGMAKGDMPILLVGRIVPQATYDFVKQSVKQGKLTGLMLVGSGLTFTAYDMRDKVQNELAAEGVSATLGVTIRFAQAVPGAGGDVIGLDIFSLPAYKPRLNVSAIEYNRQSGNVMASVGNMGDGPAYFTMEVRVKVDGSDFKVLGDSETRLVESGEVLGVEYPLDLSSVEAGTITADVTVRFGSSKTSVEDFLTASGPLTVVQYADASDVSVQNARYDADKRSILVTLRNNGDEAAYVLTRVELALGGVPSKISSGKTEMVGPASLLVQEFPVQISEADFASGQNATAYVDYGGRQGFLGKSASYSFGLRPASNQAMGTLMVFVLVGVVVLALVLAFFLLKGRRVER